MPPDQAAVRLFAGLHVNRMLREAFPQCGVLLPSLPKTATVREFINQYWLRMECRAWRPDILHKTLYCRHEPPAGLKLVITLHDLAPARYPEYFPEAWYQTAMVRYWASRADAILAVSETTRRDAIEILAIPPARIAVVRHGVARREPSAFENAVSPHPRPYLLYVGQRYLYKNFRNLVRAYIRSGRVCETFDLVCFGGADFSSEERSLAGGRLHFRGGDDATLLHYYVHARALVLPSVYEGFGLPIVEAMSAGCPVVCSDIPSSREIAGDGAAYFPPENVEAMTAVLERVLFDEEMLERNVALGRERAGQFSWSKCAAETAAVYRSL